MWIPDEPAKPRLAAAAIVMRDVPGGDEVLLARRNKALAFMGGHHVFPGGRIDDTDRAERIVHVEDGETARAMYAAAREVFEEAGLLCARGTRPDQETLRRGRHDLLADKVSFDQLLDAWHLELHGEDFVPAGTWLTPPFSPMRYRTRYFITRPLDPDYAETVGEEGEIVGLDWMTPAEARRRWHAGEIRLSTPIAFVLRHLAHQPLDAALPWLHRTPGLDDHVPNRFEMRRGIHIIPVRSEALAPATHTNCIAIGEEELYVVDPGASDPQEQAQLIGHLEDLLAIGDRIAAILLTHGHQDHRAAAPLLREHFGAPIWAHAATPLPEDFPRDRALAGGEVIEVAGTPGWRIRCLHTPGHDPGHLALLEESTRTLLAGDLVANPGTILVAHALQGNMNDYLASLARMLDERFSFTIPAHGLPIFGEAGKDKFREIIAHRHAREAKIVKALDEGAATIDAIVEQAYADTPRSAWPYAAMQVGTHLERLGRSVPG